MLPENCHNLTQKCNPGGPSLGTIAPLVDVLRGDVCRHLLRATQNDDLAVFSLSLRVVFNMFMSIKDHMKVQLEVFLTSVHLRLLQSNNSSIPAREELALESLLEFCREPALMHDLYTNYDCDVQCTNLFDSIISTLCKRAVPIGLQLSNDSDNPARAKEGHALKDKEVLENLSVNILNRLALSGVLSVLHAVSGREKCTKEPIETEPKEPTASAFKSVSGGAIKSSAKWADASSPDSQFKRVLSHESAPCRGRSDDSLESQVDRWCTDSTCPATPDSQLYQDSSCSTPTDELYANEGCLTPSKDPDDDLRASVTSSSPPSPVLGLMTRSDLGDDSDLLVLARARTADMLRQRKMRKQRLKMAAEKFNEKPLKVDRVTCC
jgi:Guanine nucleotide exchange factor in Golgi transport N-terminal